MYTDSSEFYDLIYSFKDYQKESTNIVDIIKLRHPNCKSLLDIGCGTAEHHKYLKEAYTLDGIDLNPKFIEIAKTKNEHGNYWIADMRNFALNKNYDVILCLFSSIGYLKRLDDIVSALKCFAAHLNPNGMVIVEPWFTPVNYYPGRIGMLAYDKNEIKICRMTQSNLEDDLSVLDIQYLVGTPQQGLKHFSEKHELRLTSNAEMITAFKLAGFNVEFDENGLIGRGLYYAYL